MISARAEIGAGGNANRRQNNIRRHERQTPDVPTAPRPSEKYPNVGKCKGHRKTTTESATSPTRKRPARSKAAPAADKAPTAPSGPSAKRRKNIRTSESVREAGKQRLKAQPRRQGSGRRGQRRPSAADKSSPYHRRLSRKDRAKTGIPGRDFLCPANSVSGNCKKRSPFVSLLRSLYSLSRGRAGRLLPLCHSFALLLYLNRERAEHSLSPFVSLLCSLLYLNRERLRRLSSPLSLVYPLCFTPFHLNAARRTDCLPDR